MTWKFTERARKFLLSALIALTLALILFKPIFARPQIFDPATDLVNQVNALRASHNLPPYQINSVLMSIAQTQADHISKTGVVTHFDAQGLRPYQRAIDAGYAVAGDLSQGGFFSENILSGVDLSPADVVKSWQADDQHLAALLSPNLKDIGVGVALASGATYYVLDAGSRAEDAALPVVGTSTPTLPPNAIITSTPLVDGSIYHIVQPKEALWNIALAYSISVDDIKRLNRLTTNDILEGQKILIYKPKAGPTTTPTTGVTFTATFGIPTSTATQPVTPTVTTTATPLPLPPAASRGGAGVVALIVLVALSAAGIGSWLTSKKSPR